jgi:hypothetical protein
MAALLLLALLLLLLLLITGSLLYWNARYSLISSSLSLLLLTERSERMSVKRKSTNECERKRKNTFLVFVAMVGTANNYNQSQKKKRENRCRAVGNLFDLFYKHAIICSLSFVFVLLLVTIHSITQSNIQSITRSARRRKRGTSPSVRYTCPSTTPRRPVSAPSPTAPPPGASLCCL